MLKWSKVWWSGLRSLVFVFGVALVAQSAIGQCAPQWQYAQEQRFAGTSGQVDAVTTWDPDGAGPLGTHVVAGGIFRFAGDAIAEGLAKWDGVRWTPIGTGLRGWIRRVCVFNGELYASGTMTIGAGAEFEGIARFDGQEWSSFAVVPSSDGRVYAMLPVGTDLIVGGQFTQLNGQPYSNIARWSGGSWSSLGSGVTGNVFALAEFQGAIVAGGAFTAASGTAANRVARFSNGAWSPLGVGLGGNVWALQVFENQLYAGGTFQTGGSGATMRLLARWNGSAWSAVSGFSSTGGVQSLHVLGNTLYVGGTLPNIGGTSPNGLARVVAGTLQTAGSGPQAYINCMTTFNNELFLGSGLYGSGRLAVMNPATLSYRRLLSGRDGDVNGFVLWRGEILDSGYIPADGSSTSGTLWAFNGEHYRPFSTNSPFDIRAYAVYNGELYVGGLFTGVGTESVAGIVKWDGQAWRRVGVGLNSNAMVHAMCVYQGELYVGGCFTSAGGIPCQGFAAWNGTSWRVPAGTSGCVYALREFGGELFVGGLFNSIGSLQTVKNLGRFNGTTWRTAGPGMVRANNSLQAEVYDFEEYNGMLIAGGKFEIAGGTWAYGVAQWNQALGWQPMANDVQPNPAVAQIVNALEVYDGRLYAVGVISNFGTTTLSNIGVWDGQFWSSLGTGVDFDARAVIKRANELYIGGRFSLANGRVSPGLARFGCPCRPDLNADTAVDTADIFEFLNDWFGGDFRSDYNGSRQLDVSDIFDFLNAWFVGCS